MALISAALKKYQLMFILLHKPGFFIGFNQVWQKYGKRGCYSAVDKPFGKGH